MWITFCGLILGMSHNMSLKKSNISEKSRTILKIAYHSDDSFPQVPEPFLQSQQDTPSFLKMSYNSCESCPSERLGNLLEHKM